MMRLRAELRHYRTALRRLHRSRGYGIHSPFAFRFVRDVLRGRRCRYYADSELTAARRRLKRRGTDGVPSSGMLRRLHRVVSHLQPSRVIIYGNPDPLSVMAVTLASARATQLHVPPGGCPTLLSGDMIYINTTDGCETLSETICDALQADGCIYLTDIRDGRIRALFERLRHGLSHAQIFCNDREAVMVCRRDFTAQYYSLWF